ncbi:MAG TPA: hypothetical protein VL201_03245 [Patescibacteria group bacterium]|jgi:hypothetical protein|nr:hypothetical protein [Patescibacteria group bacterium]
MRRVFLLFCLINTIFSQINGSYIHKIADCTLSTADALGKNPFFGLVSFLGFGLVERTILSFAPDSLLTDENKGTYNNKKLTNSRLFAAIKLTTFLLCGGLYYINFRSKSKVSRGIRIFGDIVACGDLFLSFMLIYESAKK